MSEKETQPEFTNTSKKSFGFTIPKYKIIKDSLGAEDA